MNTAIKTELLLLAGLVFGSAVLFSTFLYTDNPCNPSQEGTDYWYEVCMNEGEIDLGADQSND